MKFVKVFALAGVIAFAANAQAQETYAPEKGDFSVEIEFNPFSNDFHTFRIDQLKGRWFMTDNDALRFGIGFGIDNSKKTNDPEKSDVWSKSHVGSFSIDLGYERNVFSYKRINLYAGAGLSFELNRESSTEQGYQTMGRDDNYQAVEELHSVKKCNINDSYNAFYAKAFTGIDFFVYKGLFVGAELGLRVGVKSFLSSYTKGGLRRDAEGNVIVTNGLSTWDDDYESPKGPKSNNFELSLYAEPAIRLGWQF